MRTAVRVIGALVLLLLLAGGAVVLSLRGGQRENAGEVATSRVPPHVVAARARTQAATAQALAARSPDTPVAPADKQILFGDLHVHTTFSADAFQRSLPLLQGEGAHPPADACDFARFCADLDFWSINDHAESVSPQHWRETKESIRQCNAAAGDPANPDVVAFLGWEWTQVGQTPETHYGHKNVIFKDTAEDAVPRRQIAAAGRTLGLLRQSQPLWQRFSVPLLDFENRKRYLDFGEYQAELRAVPECPAGVDTRELPEDCLETADTPDVLFEKLAQWGFDSIVIPHGTTWGLYTPPGSTLDKQLVAAQHDPARQTLFEIFSGHGNSEEHRTWKEIDWDAAGNPVCAEPTASYLPCCWQAGELIRARCGDASPAECDRRVAEARLHYLNAGVAGHLTVPGSTAEEWLDCGQCRDCYLPSFGFRPGNSAQYALAISNFDDPEDPRRFRFGFIASSDNHSARPGTGYKDYDRREMTEATGARDQTWFERLNGPPRPRGPESLSPEQAMVGAQVFQIVDFERQASFFMTGGLVAVHSPGRDRDAIWGALGRREVYGTSGDRILLWFDLLNGPEGALPMGAETRLGETPRFQVRAAGAFEQNAGCPESSLKALSAERLERLCRGECYNPTDTRRRITRIEVVRVRPQVRKGEPVAPLIEDPWKRFDCPADPAGCVVEFEDPEFLPGGRDVTYYVRAVQEPTPAINADGLRCERDASGDCVKVRPCYGDYRTPFDDDCLAMNEERAWSSPIYLRPEA